MKYPALALSLLLLGAASVAHACETSKAPAGSDKPPMSTHTKNMALFEQAQKNMREDHEKWLDQYQLQQKILHEDHKMVLDLYNARLKDMQDIHGKRAALIEKDEKMHARADADLTRFENVLSTWEKQQAEYQSYLDSLKKK